MFNHATIERNATILLVLGFITVAIGGIVEIAPLFYLQNTIEKVEGMRPYTPLELAGRKYVLKALYLPSQMIRPLPYEPERYGITPGGRIQLPSFQWAQSAPAPIWPASATGIPMTGTASTWLIPAPSCPSRSCRAIPS